MVDLDAFLFTQSLDRNVGDWLTEVRKLLTDVLARNGVLFELRIVDGPYKPPIARLTQPIMVAHLGVFTEQTYLESPALRRWAWRKYPCTREPGRLARLAPHQPTVAELLFGRKGIDDRLHDIERGAVEMRELVLPDLHEEVFSVTLTHPNFLECCFASVANSARNHCRVLSFPEADRLGNKEFFVWYNENIFRSDSLMALMQMKADCRIEGFSRSPVVARTLAVEFLRQLRAHLATAKAVTGETL